MGMYKAVALEAALQQNLRPMPKGLMHPYTRTAC